MMIIKAKKMMKVEKMIIEMIVLMMISIFGSVVFADLSSVLASAIQIF